MFVFCDNCPSTYQLHLVIPMPHWFPDAQCLSNKKAHMDCWIFYSWMMKDFPKSKNITGVSAPQSPLPGELPCCQLLHGLIQTKTHRYQYCSTFMLFMARMTMQEQLINRNWVINGIIFKQINDSWYKQLVGAVVASYQTPIIQLYTDVHQSNMMGMMVSLQKHLWIQSDESSEGWFFMHTLQSLIMSSGHQVELEDWTITSYKVEFKHEVGSDGL